jgi:hypothetical protein
MRDIRQAVAPLIRRLLPALRASVALAVCVLIIAIGSAIPDCGRTSKSTPRPVPSSPEYAATACRLYELMNLRLEKVERIGGTIPPDELVTAARRQEFEQRRDSIKRPNALQRLVRPLINDDDGTLASKEHPRHPYFDEPAIWALNHRTAVRTMCQWIRDDVEYADSVERVYAHYRELQQNRPESEAPAMPTQ